MPEITPGTWDLHFPKAGVDVAWAFGKQPNRPVGPQSEYARTAANALNVRAFEQSSGRMRGGSRCGHSKLIDTQVVDGTTWIVQHLSQLVGTDFDPPSGTVQLSNSGRVVLRVAVSQGRVFTSAPGDSAFTEATNSTGETPPLNFSGPMASTQCIQKLWMSDGVNYAVLHPQTNTVHAWTATAGNLPRDNAGNGSRLLCTWRGRVGHSGLPDDPQNWFLSKVNDPTNYNYFDPDRPSTMAVFGNNAPMGLVGDPVTTMIPFTDDVLVFGGQSSIYAMRGDPLAGGSMDLVTNRVGMVFGHYSWCMDPLGVIYFFSNHCGVYRWELTAGSKPQRISQAIDNLLRDVNAGEYGITMVWDERREELKLYVTNLSRPTTTVHYTWESRTGGWQPDAFANSQHDPLCAIAVDGNRPQDRVVLIGSWDGYVRYIDEDATTDDGEAINSEVWIGPLLTKTLDEVTMSDLQAVLGESSGSVTCAVHVGRTAEAARASTAVQTLASWTAGRGHSSACNRGGHAIYLKLTSTAAWQMEAIRLKLEQRGVIRQRTKGAS